MGGYLMNASTARVASASGFWPRRSFLGALPESARTSLLAVGSQREYSTGSSLIVEGDACTDVIALVDGWAKVVSSTSEGGRALLGLRFSGDLVGEQSALECRPRSASVIAAGLVQAHVVRRQDFLRFLMDWPEAGVAVGRMLSAKLRWATSRRVDFSGLPVLTRLARVLAELAELGGTPVTPGMDFGYTLTQPEFAEMIGASEPSVHKALRQLRGDGVIETGYRRIVIRDPAALAAIAESGCSGNAVDAASAYPVSWGARPPGTPGSTVRSPRLRSTA
jgi:CRP/FNR family transcriptional regulator, cyclic AMP receptor protein